MNSKDLMIVQKIISYCGQIQHSHSVFGTSYEVFAENVTYQNGAFSRLASWQESCPMQRGRS